MESPSNLTNLTNLRSLSQTLALKKAQDAVEVAELTSQELTKLGNDLQRQSSAVLTTTALAITQTAAKEMQHVEQQLSPQIEQIRQSLSQQLGQMQAQIAPAVTQMQSDVSQRLEKMQAQIDQQLKPLDEAQLKARMSKLQGQINAQTKPLLAALGRVKSESEALALMTATSWLKPVLISLCVLLSISLPAWGLIAYLSGQVHSNLVLIQRQQQTLQQLQAQTWGVTLQQDSNGQFLVLPEGTVAETGWKFGKRQGVKLLKK